MTLWQRTAQRFLGGNPEPMIEPPQGDRRFRDAAWNDNTLFDFIKQSYLLTARWLQTTVRDAEGIDERTARKVDFYTRQFVDALAPSNFLMTNPEVLRATIESRGENLLQRAQELARRPGARQRPAGDQDDRHGGVPDRREHRGDARQGRLPERPDPTDPIRADDRDGQTPAIADHAALDQQVLHSRSAARQLVHSLGGGAGPHRLRDFLGQPRRASRRQDLCRLHARGSARRPRRDRTGDRRTRGQRHRLLPRRHAARRHARLYGGQARQPDQKRDFLRDDGRFCRGRRAFGLYRRGTARGARTAHEQARAISKAATWRRPSTCCAPTI